jgi:hypothetical protein
MYCAKSIVQLGTVLNEIAKVWPFLNENAILLIKLKDEGRK